jgi:hypothetical protein
MIPSSSWAQVLLLRKPIGVRNLKILQPRSLRIPLLRPSLWSTSHLNLRSLFSWMILADFEKLELRLAQVFYCSSWASKARNGIMAVDWIRAKYIIFVGVCECCRTVMKVTFIVRNNDLKFKIYDMRWQLTITDLAFNNFCKQFLDCSKSIWICHRMLEEIILEI